MTSMKFCRFFSEIRNVNLVQINVKNISPRDIHRQTFQVPRNGGTEPYKAIFAAGFPLHKPYIQLIQVSTSILGTWNVWWIQGHLLRFGIWTPKNPYKIPDHIFRRCHSCLGFWWFIKNPPAIFMNFNPPMASSLGDWMSSGSFVGSWDHESEKNQENNDTFMGI